MLVSFGLVINSIPFIWQQLTKWLFKNSVVNIILLQMWEQHFSFHFCKIPKAWIHPCCTNSFLLVARFKLTPKFKSKWGYVHMSFKTILAKMSLVISYARNCAIVWVVVTTKMNEWKSIKKTLVTYRILSTIYNWKYFSYIYFVQFNNLMRTKVTNKLNTKQ